MEPNMCVFRLGTTMLKSFFTRAISLGPKMQP